jgi:hypothetical protein
LEEREDIHHDGQAAIDANEHNLSLKTGCDLYA